MIQQMASPSATVLLDGEYLYNSLKNILSRPPLPTERVDYAQLKTYVINSLGYANPAFEYHQRQYSAAGPFYSALRRMGYTLHLIDYSLGWHHVKTNLVDRLFEVSYLDTDLIYVGGDSFSGQITAALNEFVSSKDQANNRLHIIHFSAETDFSGAHFQVHDLAHAVEAVPRHVYAVRQTQLPNPQQRIDHERAPQPSRSMEHQPHPDTLHRPASDPPRLPPHSNTEAESHPPINYPGAISASARTYLDTRPAEKSIVESFLHAFDITYASRTPIGGHTVPFYFLKPLNTLSEQFNIEQPIVAIDAGRCTESHEYIAAIKAILEDEFVKSQIDPSRVFLIANEPKDRSESSRWQLRFARTSADAPLLVSFDRAELQANRWTTGDALLAAVTAEFHKKDWFDETQPLTQDEDFFGRQTTIDSLVSAFHQGKNRGLFGLRKTGKTSIFKKLERLLAASQPPGALFFLDCQSPATYGKRWDELLNHMADGLAAMSSQPLPKRSNIHAVEWFETAVRNLSQRRHLAIVFDEIEYITPWAFGRSRMTRHWEEDYVPFWQTIRSVQQRLRTFSIFVGGVIPKVTEVGTIDGLPNPLFNLVEAEYVASMTEDEIGDMVNTFGSRMGLHFSADAIDYLRNEYGGFPRLTRQACSLIHKMVIHDPYQKFPFLVTRDFLAETEGYRNESLSYVSGEILHHLEEFYPEEHALLRQIAVRDEVKAYPSLRDGENTHHLRRYGLLREAQQQGLPEIAIPIVQHALQGETERWIVPGDVRDTWLSDTVRDIDVRLAEFHSIISGKNVDAAADDMLPDVAKILTGAQSNLFHTIDVVADEREWVDFLYACHQAFIEPFGGYTDLQTELGVSYPKLTNALWRLATYRHKAQHPVLKPKVQAAYLDFHNQDLNGKSRVEVGADYWFVLQQRTLEGLALAVVMEINDHS